MHRELTLRDLPGIFIASAKTTAVVLFLCAAALVTSYMITLANLPGELAQALGPLIQSPVLFMLAVLVLLTLVGMALDLTPTILILGPVLTPLAIKAKIDPVYFGVMFVMIGTIGLLTPPVGSVLNAVCGVTKVRMEYVIRSVLPYVFAYTALVILFILFPKIVTVPAKFFH